MDVFIRFDMNRQIWNLVQGNSQLGTCFCTWLGQSGSNYVFPAAGFHLQGADKTWDEENCFSPPKQFQADKCVACPIWEKYATKILFHPFTVWTSGSTLSHWGHQPEDSLPRSGGPVLFRKRPTARGVKSCAWDRLDVSEFRLNPPNSVSMILAVYIHSWENAAWVCNFLWVQFPRQKYKSPKTMANMHLFQSKIKAYKRSQPTSIRGSKRISFSHSMCLDQPWLHGLLFRPKWRAISRRLHVGGLSGDWQKHW